ncbi:ribosomal protein S6 kinase delta-1 [Scaptodrosophila lebanonensis]|uniref:Ribosomal protein S6 kinase delta-1 n=1 Tax=Drosophila lebanonensis TaxID=7225 RepID=A0A6J2TDA5_DROLE|nr:ribosomal protein S6 kinase delta-1 [Scaptodrosophila lebanonensis]
MSLNLGGWIHSFTVTDTQKHKGGYTIYKITSIVFPRSVPQALTCLVVWKRFHEIKRLHRELSRRHKSLKLPGKLPEPTDSTYFARFDENVIQRRKDYILQLLDAAAQHPALYKCYFFTQFFNDAHSPNTSPLRKLYVERTFKLSSSSDMEQTESCIGESGAIAEICDKLDLPYDHHDAGGITPLDPRCDKTGVDDGDEQINNDKNEAADDDEIDEVPIGVHNKRDHTRFLTPMASVESDDSDYIYEAALEFSHAVQAEVNLEYKVAHDRYKRGVELLLSGAKDDANDDRKFIAKAKIAKYLARADEIQARFLSETNVATGTKKLPFQLSLDVVDSGGDVTYLECAWNQLAKYKVLQILGERVMQVQCVTQPHQPAAIMKGVEKPASNSPTQSIFLPQQVPYMVELLAYFQSEQKIFLLLKQAEGGRLYDYIKTYSPTSTKCSDYAELFPALGDELSDEPLTAVSDVNDLVRSSQQLLKSVSHTLQAVQAGTPRRLSRQRQLETSRTRLPEASMRQWACELAVAIHSLHGKGIILRDLNMANILLGAKGQLLLTYFYQNEGLSSDDNYVHKALSLTAVAGHFVAPERPLSFKSDWWSYGVVLYQLLLGLPYKTTHPGQVGFYGCVQYPDTVDISDSARDLLDKLLQVAPEQRLDYEQLQSHEFFDGINWQDVQQRGCSGF